MTRDTLIDVIDGRIKFSEKWEEEFCTFTLETVRTILFFLKNKEDDDLEG